MHFPFAIKPRRPVSRFYKELLWTRSSTNRHPRVVFGEGTSARLAERGRLAGYSSCASPDHAGPVRLGREIAGRLGERLAGLFAGAVMHTRRDRGGAQTRCPLAGGRRHRGGWRVNRRTWKGDLATHRSGSDRNSDDLRGVRDDADPRGSAHSTRPEDRSRYKHRALLRRRNVPERA